MQTFFQDLRFGFRLLRRSPGFSVLAFLCLTLGIGSNAAVLSWIEGILFRPFPAVAHQERMVAITGTARSASGANRDALSYPDFLDFQKNCTLFDSFIVDRITGTTLSVGDRAERAVGAIVSANYFDALRVRPIMGRGFKPEEDTGRNAHPVTVISYETWKNRYKGDPEIIGKTQYLNGVQHTIIGVAPENFHGTFVGYSFQFWVPTSMQETFDSTGYKLEDRGARWIEGYAFLKPGVTIAQAQAELSGAAKRLENDYPETNRGRGVQLFPLWKTPFNQAGPMVPTLGIALAVVLFVLLIACANIGNLFLVRSLLRRHEITVRIALGAGRGRLLRQLFTEGMILAVAAAAGGVLVAYWFRNALVLAFPPPLPGTIINLPGHIDWRVLVLSAAVCILATLLFALAPAIQATKVDLAGALKAESGGVVSSRKGSWLRSALMLVQVCLSFVLVAGSGLVIQSLGRVQNASPGFSTKGIVLSVVDLFSAGYNSERARIFNDELLNRVRALPGVESVAISRVRPFSYRDYSSAPIAADRYQPAPDEQPTADYNEVSEGYFTTIGIPIVFGREFTRSDDENAQPVAIVNETMAAKYWPGKDPVGQRLEVKGRWIQVVGVAKNSNYRTKLETPQAFFYVPLRQNFSVQTGLIIRTQQNAAAILTPLAQAVQALDPNLAPLDTITMQEQVDRMTYTQRLSVVLLGIFGAMALLLAVIGLYGVMSYVVSQSTRELGLRMALGAGVADLLRLIMSRGVMLTAAGIGLGIVAAFGVTRFLGELLYKVNPHDPLAFGTAFAVITIASLAACFFPAWRATRIDPVQALREQ
jgi:macrolide transport system ATP-binding/permease protein